MNKQRSLTVQLEIVWWIVTAIVAFAFLFPIKSKISEYPFQLMNILFIVVALTFARYFLFLKYTFLGERQKLKAAIFVLCIPLAIGLLHEFQAFQNYIVEHGIESFATEISVNERLDLGKYIKGEMRFFGVASIMMTIILPFRLLLSIWRFRNRGTV